MDKVDRKIEKDPYGNKLKYLICRDCYSDWWNDCANSVELMPEN